DIETSNKNAEISAERAGHLYDKVSGFLTSMDKLDKNLAGAQKSFDEAKSQLTSGRGSVVRQVELLQKLGAKTNKPIPPSWKEEGDVIAPPPQSNDTEEFVPEFLMSPEEKPTK
ncbi:MAG: DNA recombination protein RmuC, partial [Devosiaceae bacterium]|nr:DNA recombination protein RmuC [Devosiaceae bacterium]